MDHQEHAMPWERVFAQNIRRLREEAGMSQSALARVASSRGMRFHQQQVDRIERGSRPVRLNEAVLLSQIFSTRLEDLIPADLDTEAARDLAQMATRQYVRATDDTIKRTTEAWVELEGARKWADASLCMYRQLLVDGSDEAGADDTWLWESFKSTKETEEALRKIVLPLFRVRASTGESEHQ